MKELLKNKKDEIEKLCQELQIKRMYLFGSAETAEFTKKSDIDFLISFKDNLSIEDYTNNYFALHYKLRELFNREIDIITERSLSNPYLIDSINKSKRLIYEARDNI